MEWKVLSLDGAPVFIARGGNGSRFTVATISAAVTAEDGNGPPRSHARFRFPSVAAKDPVASILVLSGSRDALE